MRLRWSTATSAHLPRSGRRRSQNYDMRPRGVHSKHAARKASTASMSGSILSAPSTFSMCSDGQYQPRPSRKNFGRPAYPATSSFLVVVHHDPFRLGGADGDSFLRRDRAQYVRLPDVESLLEQAPSRTRRLTRSPAGSLSSYAVATSSRRGQRRHWHETLIEPSEEIGRDLLAQLQGVLCHDARFQRLPVDELQRPGTNP